MIGQYNLKEDELFRLFKGNEQVWRLVTSLVTMNRFTLCTIANYRGRLYNLPFNMYTFHQMWGVVTPDEARCKIDINP
ncbi:MAG: hypothetical protein IJ528_08770 [Bacteroidaceae bacterium]|nr:hypothetical protein [Bacteroidaceae bacterium]